MERRVTASMLEGFAPVVVFLFKILYPNGLTLSELKVSEHGWLRSIYDHFKDGDA